MSTPSDPFSTTPPPAQTAWQPAPTWDAASGQTQPYGPPPAYGASFGHAGPTTTSTQAVIALGFAIASYFPLPVIGAIVALVLVPGARKEIDASGGSVTGDGLLTAAKVLAWVNIALCVVTVLALAVVFLLLLDAGFS